MKYIVGKPTVSSSRGTLYEIRYEGVYVAIAQGHVSELRKLADMLNT